MNVYDIRTPFNHGTVHSVVAKNMGEAERLFQNKYGSVRILEIRLHAEYVILNARDEVEE